MTIIGHKKQWEFLKNNFELNRLSHAYLFAGANGIGKKSLAIEFAKLANCLSEGDRPCQKCANCQMIEKNSFPDLLIVRSADSTSSIKDKTDNREIDISQIRNAQNFLSYKSYYGSFKIVIVDDAERMNQEAQNCFLKTLEEPKGQTLLFLVTSKPDMMLPTIFSRCQTLKFFQPKDLPKNLEKLEVNQKILNELVLILNSDLADKFKYVKGMDFEKQKIGDTLEILQRYLRYLLFVETGVGEIADKDMIFSKTTKLVSCNPEKIKKVINLIEEINSKLIFTNANPKLALEILLMEA